MPDLTKVQERLQVRFSDPFLLQRALTHRSYLNEHPEHMLEDNERLEFLGDAVLDFIAGAWLYHRFPEMDEGQLTRLRAGLVRTETLAHFAQTLRLGDALLLGRGGRVGRAGGSEPCGSFEALVARCISTRGWKQPRAFAEPCGAALQDILRRAAPIKSKCLLQEWSQAELGQTPRLPHG